MMGKMVNGWKFYESNILIKGRYLCNGKRIISLAPNSYGAKSLIIESKNLLEQYIVLYKRLPENAWIKEQFEVEHFVRKVKAFVNNKTFLFAGLISIVAFLLLLTSIYSIDEFLKAPYVNIKSGGFLNGVDISLFSVIILLYILCTLMLLFLVYLLMRSILIKTILSSWLKKIISTYISVIIIFAVYHTSVVFYMDYKNTLNSLNYYMPNVYINSSRQNDFIKRINLSKTSIKINSYIGSEISQYTTSENKICKTKWLRLNKNQINYLKKQRIKINLKRTYQVIVIDYKAVINIFFNMVYFSIVTITTAGYGDILPVSSIAKIITCLELLIGQLLMIIGIGMAFNYAKDIKK
jgi:hypothetical protein